MNVRQSIASLFLACVATVMGCGGASGADPKQVALEPQKYAGQTLQSDLRMNGFGEGGVIGFRVPLGNGYAFGLKSPSSEMTEKLTKASSIAGEFGSVVVTYKVDDTVPKDAASIGTIVDVATK